MRMICHHLDFTEKRVLIYSHYSEREEVESYNYLTLERMGHRFDYIVVLTNCPNQWQFAAPDYNKYHMLGYNFKSDFRNYGVFIAQAAKQLKRAAQVCLMNDSFVVVDVAAFDRCMRRMFDQVSPTCDFMGITGSHENGYHLQSYFMCFNNAGTVGAVMDYFNAHGLPMNHHVAISVYELGITPHLMARGFKPFAMVSNDEMPVPLNTTCFKWSAVLQATGIVKRQHFLKQYPPRIAMTDLNIALVANKFSENKHFIHFLNYHGIKWD
jgi:lipopolysaccharide biosynthesis protein